MSKVIGLMRGGRRFKLKEFECKAHALNKQIHGSDRNSGSKEVQRKQFLIPGKTKFCTEKEIES